MAMKQSQRKAKIARVMDSCVTLGQCGVGRNYCGLLADTALLECIVYLQFMKAVERVEGKGGGCNG